MEQKVKDLEGRVRDLEKSDIDTKTRLAVAENNIRDIRNDIQSIKDDTKWLRRAFTNAIIAATITAIVGGLIGLVFWIIKGGI